MERPKEASEKNASKPVHTQILGKCLPCTQAFDTTTMSTLLNLAYFNSTCLEVSLILHQPADWDSEVGGKTLLQLQFTLTVLRGAGQQAHHLILTIDMRRHEGSISPIHPVTCYAVVCVMFIHSVHHIA